MKMYCMEHKEGVQLQRKNDKNKQISVGYIVFKQFVEGWGMTPGDQEKILEIISKNNNEYNPIFFLDKAKDTIRKCREMFTAYYQKRVPFLEFRPNSKHEVNKEEQLHINALIDFYSFKFANDNADAFELVRTEENDKKWIETKIKTEEELIKLGY